MKDQPSNCRYSDRVGDGCHRRDNIGHLMAFSAMGVWLAGLSLLAPILFAEATTVWLNVPFVRQEANGCGAAAVAMLMRFWSFEAVDPHKIYQALHSVQPQGGDVERFLRTNGFQTFVFRGEWQGLEEHLAKDHPLMVCLREEHAGPFHYVVIAGMDTQQNVVFINDPARRGLLKVQRDAFEIDWVAADRWTLLAVPYHAR